MSARTLMRMGLRGTTPVGAVEDAGPWAATPPQQIELPVRLFPPVNWLNVDQLGYVVLPAIGAEAVIVSFLVPKGYNGVIKKVGNNFVGGGWVEGTGAIIWKLLVDKAPPAGANSYNSIPGSLGSPASPTELPGGFRVYENQLIEFVVDNVSVAFANQQVGARLVGYLYPRDEEDPAAWT